MEKINKKHIIYSIFLFLASRAGLSGIAPFGIAAFAAIHSTYEPGSGYINILLYGISCIIGAVSTGVLEQILITSFGVLIYITGCNLIKKNDIDGIPVVLRYSIILVISILIPMCFISGIFGATLMDVINLIIQCVVAFIIFYVFRIAENAISEYLHKNFSKNKINNEELICIAIALAIGFLGIPSVIIFGLSLRNIVSLILIMIFSLRGNIGTGAAAGVMIGLLTNTSAPIVICAYGFCGFVAGLLNKFGKAGVIIAFITGNIILCFLFGAKKELIYSMYETGFATILFALLPINLYDFIKIPIFEESSMFKKITADKNNIPIRFDYVGKIRNKIIEKAELYSETLNEMSSEILDFSTISSINKKEDSEILRVYNKVCSNCRLYNECCKNNYKSCEKNFIKCKNIILKNGDKRAEATKILNDFCIKAREVIEELRIAIEIQRIERICNSKLSENRSMLIKQISELGKISTEIGENIKYSTNYDIDKEKIIINTLKKYEVCVYDVIVTKNKNNMPEVYLYLLKKYNDSTIKNVNSILSKIFNKKMEISYIDNIERKGLQEIKFQIKSKIKVSFGICCLPAKDNDISGDSYCFYDKEDGNTYMILSDGMGTGKDANIQSSSVINILELYIKSGINIFSGMSTIDMILSAGSNEVFTSSVDLCYINRQSSKIYFSKMGAVPSLIIKENDIKIIEINRPPAGISADFFDNNYALFESDIFPGDYIVMFTDGIYDGFEHSGINKKVMYEYIASVVRKIDNKTFDCNMAAEEIGRKVFNMYDGNDDCCISILYIEKNL